MTDARPGQTEPNDLERCVLERIGRVEPWVLGVIAGLHVLSRTYTGVGCYTRFKWSGAESAGRYVSLGCLIEIPGVSDGLGATAACYGEEVAEIEIFTYGGVLWDGSHEGFSIEC